MNCPICEKETAPVYRPFCSRRCADLDLGNWLTGQYSIPSDELEEVASDNQADRQDESRCDAG